MTRLPGTPLENSFDPLQVELEEPWLFEPKECVTSMRTWSSPYTPNQNICSALGTSLRSSRVPDHMMGPFTDEEELHNYLLSPASGHGFHSTAEYTQALRQANKIRKYSHQITFTHGDFKAHNILIGDDGHLSGFLDWESAGWYPEYWDFTTAMRYGKGSWWYHVALWIGGDQYDGELACDIALNSLTVDSYVAF
ncbi:Protein kinase-like domain [Penicillium camemberti]|uniref:Protein kinase-like domain n=1 Tax=Penicillium camemberti (strain FM 013) TaxID=1429867 RepID=A0A0G4PC55_PENC3|nr:Protein kinase-like domain [Penicillium camemberti]